MGAIGGAISAIVTKDTVYGINIANIFAARGPPHNRSAVDQGL